MRAGSSNQVGGEEFSPTYGGVESTTEKTKKSEEKGFLERVCTAIKRPFTSLWKTKVENIMLHQELDPANPEPQDDVDRSSDKPKVKISQDQPKQKGPNPRPKVAKKPKLKGAKKHGPKKARNPRQREKTKKSKKRVFLKGTWKAIRRPFKRFWKTKVENIMLCQELDTDPANPEPTDDADRASDKPKVKISQDQPKQKGAKFPFFDGLRRGKVEPLPSPQPEADAANPDVRDEADLGISQSKTNVGPDKPKVKAKIQNFFHHLRRKKGDLAVPAAQHDADMANPDPEDDPDLASPSVADAELQKASIPAFIRLKGCGNHNIDSKTNKQPKNRKKFWQKSARNPRPKVEENPGQKSARNPKPKVEENPGQKSARNPDTANPDPEDDPDLASPSVADAELQKALIPASIRLKGCGNPNIDSKTDKQPQNQQKFWQKWARNLRPKYPGQEDFNSKYEAHIIEGLLYRIFKGTQKADGKQVVIKCVYKDSDCKLVSVPGYPKPLLREVAVMLKLREAPECPYVIKMLD